MRNWTDTIAYLIKNRLINYLQTDQTIKEGHFSHTCRLAHLDAPSENFISHQDDWTLSWFLLSRRLQSLYPLHKFLAHYSSGHRFPLFAVILSHTHTSVGPSPTLLCLSCTWPRTGWSHIFVQLSSGVTKAEEGSDGGWWTPPTNHHPHAGGPSSVRDSTWLDEQQQFDNLRFLFQFQEKNHLSSISTCYARCEPQAQQFVYWIQSTILPWSLTFYWSKWLS